MNKSDLVDAVAKDTGQTKVSLAVAVDSVFKCMTDGLANDGVVNVVGFGTFKVQERAARKGRNPMSGEEIDIPAKKIAKFSPGKSLRLALGHEA